MIEETYNDVKARLDEIVNEVASADISLDDALALYEEAVKLSLSACDLSESDLVGSQLLEDEEDQLDTTNKDTAEVSSPAPEETTVEIVE